MFLLQEGVVIVNPKERIEYSEKGRHERHEACRSRIPSKPILSVIRITRLKRSSRPSPSRQQSLTKSVLRGSDELNDVLDDQENAIPDGDAAKPAWDLIVRKAEFLYAGSVRKLFVAKAPDDHYA